LFNPLAKYKYINKVFREHPLAQHNLKKSWANYLLYNVIIMIKNTPAKFKWVNGLNIYTQKGDSCLGGNVFLGLMEFHESAFLVHFLQNSELFVDVGANLGHYTLLASGVCGARTIAVEPIPATYKRLCYNIMKNNIQNIVDIRNVGVGEKDGELTFSNFDNNAINYVQENENNISGLKVRVQTLNNLLSGKFPKVIKIDVEGYELFSLKGANEVLMNPDLEVLIIEINGHCRRYGNTEEEVFRFIVSFGFIPVYYNSFTRKINLLNNYNHDSDSTIFIRDLKAATFRVKHGKNIQIWKNCYI